MINPQIFRRIVVTEKSNKLMEQHQQIVFIVDWKANKPQIKQVFESIFGYKVASVNVMRQFGRPRRIGRYSGKTKRYKKAIITLVPGQKFEFLNPNQAQKTTGQPIVPDIKSTSIAPVKKGFFTRIQDRVAKLTKIEAADLTSSATPKKDKNK